MAIEWAPGLSREVGPTPLNARLKRFRNDSFSPGGYKIFRAMIAHATDDAIPIYAAAWRIWRALTIQSHLLELAGLREWATLVASFYSGVIRAPNFLPRTPLKNRPGMAGNSNIRTSYC